MRTRLRIARCMGLTWMASGASACLSIDLTLPPGSGAFLAELSLAESPWSPDGQHVLVGVPFHPSAPLFRFSIDGSEPTIEDTPGQRANWSPDGRSLAIEQEDALVVLEADCSPRFSLDVNWTNASWSPDGQWIATCTDSAIVLVRADGTGWRSIGEGSVPVWSPTGDRLACTVLVENEPWVELASPEGGPRVRLVPGALPSWSPDGRYLVCSQLSLGEPWNAPEVLLVSADGSEQRTLAQGMLPRWSPAGDLILFARVDSTPWQGRTSRSSTALYTIRPDGRDERLLAPDALAGRWSPDGSTVAVLRGIPIFISFAEPELFLVNADGSGERSLGRFPLP